MVNFASRSLIIILKTLEILIKISGAFAFGLLLSKMHDPTVYLRIINMAIINIIHFREFMAEISL